MVDKSSLNPSATLSTTSLGSRRAGPPRRSTYRMLIAAFGLLIYVGLWQYKAATSSHLPASLQAAAVSPTAPSGGKYVHPRRR
jgi:hypothetical protein